MPEQQKGQFLDFKPAAPMRPHQRYSAPPAAPLTPAPATAPTPVSPTVPLPHLQPLMPRPVPSPAQPQQNQASFPAVGMTLHSYATATRGSEARTARQPGIAGTGGGSLPPVTGKTIPAAGGGRQRGRGEKPKKQRKFWTKRVWKRIMWAFIILIVVGCGWFGWKFFYNLHKVFGNSVFSAFTTTHLNGEAAGRVNILLAGNSVDDPGHQGATLTDSIMVLSIDTRDNTAFMLSIPRDLYVQVDNQGHNKINTVYPVGQSENFDQSGYAPGGMGLLEKTIQQDFGISCQYYALVSYNALRDAVNAVGGINFDVQSSDPRGLYDPSIDYATNGPLVKLSNGEHHLDGEQALDLARARGDAYGSYGFSASDFERTQNQRELILALRTKATSIGVLTNPIRLANLFDSLGSNIKTDLTLSDARRLYQLTKGITNGGIQSIGLNDANGQDLLANYNSPNAGDSLIPAAGLDDYSDIQAYMQQITSNNPIVRDGAQVVILNGTSTVGLAAYEETRLTNQGFTIASVGDADNQETATTEIINISGKTMPNSLSALQKDYPKSTVTTTNSYASQYPGADFIVVLGSDRAQADAQAMGNTTSSSTTTSD